MSYLDALLVAEVRRTGRAMRSAVLRHRHIAPRPLAMVLWQLGAEPFTAAAVTWGWGCGDRTLVVPGEPRDRELAFRALLAVAVPFNRWIERRDPYEPPQIVVLNRASLALLGRLGRRLAFLPTEGPRAAAPELVRFGRHLHFLAEHARHPGQQLVLVLSELVADHWVTGLSAIEAQHLPAIDAAIAPPRGMTSHEAACAAETLEIGPLPGADADDVVDRLVSQFNAKRGRRHGKPVTDEQVVRPLREPFARHYGRLTDGAWDLLWRCLERERAVAEAPSVARRWKADVEALAWHFGWVVDKGGHVATRMSSRKAAFQIRAWEEAQRLLTAEEAIDDPLRMIPSLLDGRAVVGTVLGVDLEHRELATKRMVARPRVTIELDEPLPMVVGKELFWTGDAGGAAYAVEAVNGVSAAMRMTLKHTTGADRPRPRVGDRVTFSVHHRQGGIPLKLPEVAPWTHRRSEGEGSASGDIETDEGSWE